MNELKQYLILMIALLVLCLVTIPLKASPAPEPQTVYIAHKWICDGVESKRYKQFNVQVNCRVMILIDNKHVIPLVVPPKVIDAIIRTYNYENGKA